MCVCVLDTDIASMAAVAAARMNDIGVPEPQYKVSKTFVSLLSLSFSLSLLHSPSSSSARLIHVHL